MKSMPAIPRGLRRLVFHGRSKDVVDPRLIALTRRAQPRQHVGIEPDRQLLFERRPLRRRFGEEGFAQSRDLAVVNLLIGQGVKPRQVAVDRFLAHAFLPFSLR